MDEIGRVVSMALTKTKSLSYSIEMLSKIPSQNVETISTGIGYLHFYAIVKFVFLASFFHFFQTTAVMTWALSRVCLAAMFWSN